MKDYFYPPTQDRKKERMAQYKDLAMFLAAILIIAKFEDKIKAYLEIETDELKKLSSQGLVWYVKFNIVYK